MHRRPALPFNPSLQDPRKALTLGERAMLRLVDTYGARKAPRGWVCRGEYHLDATIRRLIRLGLLDEVFDRGRHRAEVSATGRTVLAILARRAPPAGDLFASAR